MLGFFIIISFFIHALSLAAIYLIYQQLQQSKQDQIKEMDQLMHSYIEQIQKENNELQEVLQEKPNLEPLKPVNTPNGSVDQQNTMAEETESIEEQSQEWNVASVLDDRDFVSVETSLESRVLQLHQEGFSTNAIAQQLNCGKTEVALIIQFQKEKLN